MLQNSQGLEFRVYGLGFDVQSLGFRVYNTLVNDFNEHLNRSCNMSFKML